MRSLFLLIALLSSVSSLSAQTELRSVGVAKATAESAGPLYDVTSRAFGAVGNGQDG